MAGQVFFPKDIAQNGRKFLEEHGYTVIMGTGTDAESLKRGIAQADAILASHESYTREVLEAGKKLKCIARFGVGYDSIDVDAATALGIQVTYTPQALTNAVSEHTLALILACAKRVVLMDRSVRENNWNIRLDNRFMSTEVKGKTLGLIGMGRIGVDVAHKARLGLGMEIIGFDPFLPADRFPEGVTRMETLDSLFSVADFVSLHLPSTPESRGLINKDLFDLMCPDSYFINCARGDVVNEADLTDALRNGPMLGAGLDVLTDEPPSPDNPILAMENVVLLPHTASFTPETRDNMGLTAAQSIDDVLSGRQPAFPVNHLS